MRIWDKADLMIKVDLSRVATGTPFGFGKSPSRRSLGLDDIAFFWKYFLQGYCATGELPATGGVKSLMVLYKLQSLSRQWPRAVTAKKPWMTGRAGGGSNTTTTFKCRYSEIYTLGEMR